MLGVWYQPCQIIAVSPQIRNWVTRHPGWWLARKKLSCVISETATDTQGNVTCHLKEAAQEHPFIWLLSHPTLGSYLNRSFHQTHISTALWQCPDTQKSCVQRGCPTKVQVSKQFLSSFPHVVTLEVWRLAPFLKTSLPSQSSYGTLAPEATNACFRVSHALSDLSFFWVFLSCQPTFIEQPLWFRHWATGKGGYRVNKTHTAHSLVEETGEPGNNNIWGEDSETGKYKMMFWTFIFEGYSHPSLKAITLWERPSGGTEERWEASRR